MTFCASFVKIYDFLNIFCIEVEFCTFRYVNVYVIQSNIEKSFTHIIIYLNETKTCTLKRSCSFQRKNLYFFRNEHFVRLIYVHSKHTYTLTFQTIIAIAT